MTNPLSSWLPAQPVRPGPSPGQFHHPATGRTSERTAQAVIQEVLSPRPYLSGAGTLDRGGTTRKALALSLRSRFDPAQADGPPWLPTRAEYQHDRTTIDPLLALPLWGQVQVIAAPLFLLEQRHPIGMAADVLARNPSSGALALLMLHTRPAGTILEPVVMAELGAAVRMFSDTYGTMAVSKTGAIWAAPNKTEITWHNPDQCCVVWADVLELSQWRQKTGYGQEQQQPAAAAAA